MAYHLPDSSLLPSTPNSRSLRSHPSTTPLVPPPSHLKLPSTTPSVPPPNSALGRPHPTDTAYFRGPGSGLKSYILPESSPPQSYHEEIDFSQEEQDKTSMSKSPNLFSNRRDLMSSVIRSPRGLKRSRDGIVRPQQNIDLSAIARSIAEQNRTLNLRESDDLILETEHLVSHLDASIQRLDLPEFEEAITTTVERLTALWQTKYPPETKEGAMGPATDDPVAAASYIASFVFQMHHPHLTQTGVSSGLKQRPLASTPIPQALLHWLNTHHNPFPDDFDTILTFQPSPSANDSFWDVVFSSLLRGRLDRVTRLLKHAGWEHAVTALDDGSEQEGYSGKQLQNTCDIVDKCVSTLLTCPAIRHANWDVKGADWSLFRQRVRSALHELEAIADDAPKNTTQRENIFAQSARGSLSLSTASRKADSQVPWSIYENMRVLYMQLQGSNDEILLVSQDWLEASIFLAVWWDGEDLTKNSRRGAQHTREVDITPLAAYQQRLRTAFALTLSQPEDPEFSINTLDVAQVGVACAMDGKVSGLLAILRTQSLPLASAVADIAAFSDWLPEGGPRSRELLNQGFDNDDLMVLSHDSGTLQGDVDRDEISGIYAGLLAERESLTTDDAAIERHGWEVAASVLGRMSDRRIANQRITALLDRIEIKNDHDGDKILSLCLDLGLWEPARRIAERYADYLADTTQRFGAMLLFYARAHAKDKLKDVLTLLTSLCLAQSTTVPPRAAMDESLVSLLAANKSGLADLAAVDSQAAAELASQLSGYAMLRRFYDLRDQDLHPDAPTAFKPLERKRQAANALLAVITSASDCIRGGLYDAAVEPVIPVDGLLVLLGEVLPLCGQSKRTMTQAHIFTLLRVIEDFTACPARLRTSSEQLLKACAHGDPPTLKKFHSNASSTSGLSESSYDMLVTSSMLLKQKKNSKPVQRAWDWRAGLTGLDVSNINADALLLMLRVSLADELGRLSVDY